MCHHDVHTIVVQVYTILGRFLTHCSLQEHGWTHSVYTAVSDNLAHAMRLLRLRDLNLSTDVLVLSTTLPSLVSFNESTFSNAHITPSSILGMSRRNMVFNFQLGRSTYDRNNMESLNLNRGMICSFVSRECARRQL